MNYSKLFIDNCPIIYFNKDEPYMPINFEDILEIAKIKPLNLYKVDIIYLYNQDKYYNQIGKQILCKINKNIEIDGNIYTDLIYIITYLWYGTNYNEHPFDKSIIIIRLDENNNIVKLCCCNNNIKWYDKNEIIFDNNKPVLFISLKEHIIFNKKIKNNTIKWEPTEFIIYNKSINKIDINIIDINNKEIDKNKDIYLYDKNIGNEYFNQQIPFNIDFDTKKMIAFYNYNGDTYDLFKNHDNNILYSFKLKILLFAFIFLMIYFDIKNKKMNLFNIIYIIFYIILFIFSYNYNS
jgi:hypothetical protein